MDFRRFISNKMMYVLLMVFSAFQIFGIFMINQYEEPTEHGGLLTSAMNESQFIQSMLAQTPSWVMIYIAVFTVYFYMSEYNSGFYKNYITLSRARINSVLSKILIQGVFTLFIFVVFILSDLIGRTIFFEQATIGDIGYFVKLLIGQIVLHWSFSIMILCITIIMRNIIASIVISIALVLNVFGMVLGVLESLITDLNLTSYLLVNTITNRTIDFNNLGDFIHVFSVAIIVMLVFSLIALNYKIREDLR